MDRRLVRVRQVLSMDANEAVDHVVLRYLGLFKRHLIPMHVFAAAMTIGPFVFLWFVGGQRWFLVVLALTTLWVAIATGVGLLRRSKFGRQS
jgi:hypothetical protein